MEPSDKGRDPPSRSVRLLLVLPVLKRPAASPPSPARCPLGFPFLLVFSFGLFGLLPVRGRLSRCPKAPLAVGQHRERRAGWEGSSGRSGFLSALPARSSLSAQRPKPTSPSLPRSEKGSSKPPRSFPPLFIFLVPPLLPWKPAGFGAQGSPVPCPYQGVDAGAGSQAVGAGGAVPAAVGPRPREQAGAEGQQRAADSQEQRHGAARRTGQPAAASSRSHPRHSLPPAPEREKAA